MRIVIVLAFFAVAAYAKPQEAFNAPGADLQPNYFRMLVDQAETYMQNLDQQQVQQLSQMALNGLHKAVNIYGAYQSGQINANTLEQMVMNYASDAVRQLSSANQQAE